MYWYRTAYKMDVSINVCRFFWWLSPLYGVTETTFYVLAYYFGAVGIRKACHAGLAGLLADVASLVAAVIV